MPRRHVGSILAALLAVGALVLAVPKSPDAVADSSQLFIFRVSAADDASAQRLFDHGFDVLENRSGGDLFVLGTNSTADQLRAAGFAPRVAEKVQTGGWQAPSSRLVPDAVRAAAVPVDETYFGGYHTVIAQQAHLDQVAETQPDLATVVDYGDSYLKTRDPATGYDLKAICLTKKQSGDCALKPDVPKPRFLLMTQIHAREIATGDMAWRFIDHLAKGYGSDAAVTELLDRTEVWVIPVVNPDGVDLVQQGGDNPYLQRKNLNDTAGGSCPPPLSGSQVGVDLNRNNGNHWNTSGVSKDPCGQTFPGLGPDSEPEAMGINTLFRQLFADQRGPGDTAAAPANTRGVMYTLHSFAEMNLFPWGWKNIPAPNDAGLRKIAEHMSTLNGYQFGRSSEILYSASGTSDDWAYGELGIASFTTELASCGDFTPEHSCTDTDWQRNLPVLMYLAGIAGAPYQA